MFSGVVIFFAIILASFLNIIWLILHKVAEWMRLIFSQRASLFLQVLHQYLNLVKPAFEEFCLPTKKYADVIIPGGASNEVAIDLILHHIHEILRSFRSPSHSSLDLDECSIELST